MEIKEEKKTTRGRRRIEMKKIEKRSQLQVTFSKRRAGLFKKAGELSVLCGVDVAVIAVSPAGKVFSLGIPSADAVVDRFLGRGSSEDFGGRAGRLRERGREKAAAEGCGGGGGFWWDRPVGELELGELERYLVALEELTCKVKSRADELAVAAVTEAMENGLPENFLDYGKDTGGSMVDPFCGFEENYLAMDNGLPENFLDYGKDTGGSMVDPFCGFEENYLTMENGSPENILHYGSDTGGAMVDPFCGCGFEENYLSTENGSPENFLDYGSDTRGAMVDPFCGCGFEDNYFDFGGNY
ncbi:Agamous-like MADS-box protein [Actinidia chinensis var. chinensis]|uniref:Agamous-like MADS-box protein n=1 Tax=Actinidia chinensis var. chinensis TaxID=1590841 RepID=A0A2R6PHW6_ACTCC|nr:Agamous-like MADS-box protein [Actinidia chinensis var. chinensis]